MELEVHLIEKYFQTAMNCFTMTNIRCKGNKEIDLLAINPKRGRNQRLDTLIGEECSLLAMYIRGERENWTPRIVVPD